MGLSTHGTDRFSLEEGGVLYILVVGGGVSRELVVVDVGGWEGEG